MNYILFDEPFLREKLKPFTFLRPIGEIRVGILTLTEKWEKYLQTSVSYLTETYLQTKFPLKSAPDNILINSSVFPDQAVLTQIQELRPGHVLKHRKQIIAWRCPGEEIGIKPLNPTAFQELEELDSLESLPDIFSKNGAQIQADFKLLTQGRVSAPIQDPHTIVYHPENIFIEEGVVLRACILNAENGVIYIGKNARISENAVIQGTLAVCEGATVNVGAKIRGDTTIGPYCKVGGEISNSVFFGYSNKGHDGFLGNSVIGEWCNLGADTNTSNLKNNYGAVKLWSYVHHQFEDIGRQFCGLMMGDHSKTGINTMFNTGTVVGINVNVFGASFPPKFIPSFSWGNGQEFHTYKMSKAFEVAEKMMQRRGIQFASEDEEIFREAKKRRSLFYNQG